jgi:hypothetical protein
MNDSTENCERIDVAAGEGAKTTGAVSRFRLWFGVFGGAVAWTIHMLLAYGIAEFGCVSSFRDARFLGITGVAWGILAMTALTLILAVGALLIARRSERCCWWPICAGKRRTNRRSSWPASDWITSVVFVAIIVAQTLPVLYYLRSC